MSELLLLCYEVVSVFSAGVSLAARGFNSPVSVRAELGLHVGSLFL